MEHVARMTAIDLVEAAVMLSVPQISEYAADAVASAAIPVTQMGTDDNSICARIGPEMVGIKGGTQGTQGTQGHERIHPASDLSKGARHILFGSSDPCGYYYTRTSLFSASTAKQAYGIASLLRNALKKARKELSVIDIGCNTGQNTRGFLRAGFSWVAAFDADPVSVWVARANTHGSWPALRGIRLGRFPEYPIEDVVPSDQCVAFLDPEWGGPGNVTGDIRLGDMGFEEIVRNLWGRGFKGNIVCKVPKMFKVPQSILEDADNTTLVSQIDTKTKRVVYKYWTDIPQMRGLDYVRADAFSYRIELAKLDTR